MDDGRRERRTAPFSMEQGNLLIVLVPGFVAAADRYEATEWRVGRLDGGAVTATDLRSVRTSHVYQARSRWIWTGVLPPGCSTADAR